MTLRLPICEEFASVQGEGKLSGTPSFFIRLGGCNLRCTWCDTPYASWKPEHASATVDELLSRAEASGRAHVVVTGGEPMLFAHLPALCDGLRARGMHITIETAGTIFREVTCDLLSISPKLRNSTPWNDPRDPGGRWAALHEARRKDLTPLHALLQRYASVQLKFVVAGESDVQEVEELLHELPAVRTGDVMLMPEGVTVPTPETVAWITRACAERGWTFCPRLHIQLFGNVRGT